MDHTINRHKLIKLALRQEYVWLTGDYKKAILLDYFMSQQNSSPDWFNVSYETISNNSLLGFTAANLKKHIKHLIDHKWIERKSDETLMFAKTFKYKVNQEKIEADIEALLAQK